MNHESKLPPHNLDAERSIIGCLGFDGSKADQMADVIQASDFYCLVNGVIFEAAMTIRRNGGEIDAITLASQLESNGKLEEVGGIPYLLEAMGSVPHGAHVGHYAGIVVEKSRLRSAIMIGRTLAEKAYEATADGTVLMEAALSATMKLTEVLGSTRKGPRLLSEHVSETIQTCERGETPTVWWGLPDIDRMIGGVMPGELIIIGARPSHGKSLLGLQWLDEASQHGIPGLMISEEMSAQSLANRSLSSITCLPLDQWRENTRRIAFDAAEHFSQRAPILIAEKCGKVSSAERAIAAAVQSHGVRIAAVDYAQLLVGEGDTKEQRVADVSARMKAAAMRHDVVVLLLAQLNRGIESRENSEPQLSDLRDSGGLENDADVAIFPFWPFKFDASYEHHDEYRIYCRKNRNRGIREHKIRMRINAPRQRLESFNPSDDWENAR